jgi:elongation factor P
MNTRSSSLPSLLLPLLLVVVVYFSASATAFVVPTPYFTSQRLSTARHVAIDTSDIKNGLTIELDGEPYKVLSFSVMKQARGAAKTTIKLKNLMRGTTLENTYRSGEKFETALIEKRNAQYTYQEGVSVILLLCICI